MSSHGHIWDRRLVMVTGKGGVGKTTVAASLARAAHAAGRRVLVAEVTTDVATRSPLLGLFGVPHPRAEEPILLADRLYGVRVTPSVGHKLFLRAALKIRVLVDAAMRSAALNRFLMAAPAFPEIGSLYQIVWLLRLERFDHVIVDLPATGHALGLASLPKTVLKIIPSGLIGDAIREGLETMTDPARGAAVIVTLPEGLPVTESFELAKGLGKLGIRVRAMVLNCVPPNPFTEEELRALDDHIRGRSDELLLGTRDLRRLQRALKAREAFRAEVPADVRRVEVPLFEGVDERGIVDHVLGVLSRPDSGLDGVGVGV